VKDLSRGRLSRGHRFDLLAEGPRGPVAIEVKNSPATLSDIRKMTGLRWRRRILCVADEAFADTAGSVMDYAAQVGIRLCPVSELASAVRDV